MKNNKIKVLVIGCSKLGAAIASKVSLDGDFITIIDKDSEAFVKLDSSYSGYTIEGDATEIPVLEKARISEMNEVNIVTDNDETNIFLGYLVDKFYPDVSTIVVRLNDEKRAVLFEGRKFKIIVPNNLALKQYEKVKEDR